MNSNRTAFTLVEIMVVLTIVGLLATMIIPNLLKAKVSANDAKAKSTLRAISTASETYATFNAGNYPDDITVLLGDTPPYLSQAYCGEEIAGFRYSCEFDAGSYTIMAEPLAPGDSGTTTFTITTGGVLSP
jgi:prepilin-type N-terminal cleavage/methylation domain-containing protein